MPLDMLALLLLPAIFLLGAITSYEDIKHGKIKNKWVVFALLYSFAAFFISIAALSLQNQPISQNYVMQYFSNILFALLAGIIIWLANLWSAGDAKLFLAYAALVPLTFYSNSYFDYFPSFVIMINTFVPFFAYYFLRTLFGTTSRQKYSLLKSMANAKFIFSNMLFIFAFGWLGSVIFGQIGSYFSFLNNVFATIFFLFLVLFIFRRILKIENRNVSIVLAIVAVLYDYQNIFSIEFLQHFIAIFFLFVFIRYFILNLTFEALSYPVYIENLKPGMAVAENFLMDKGRYEKRRIAPMGFLSAVIERSEGKFLFSGLSEGLTKDDVKKIKNLHSQGIIKGHTIRILQTVPFAPFIFFGVLLTLILKGSIFLL